MLITFSGLDGAGKSTLIKCLKTTLEEQNRKVTVLTMYDHVGLYAFVRFVRDWIKMIVKRVNGRPLQANKSTDDPHEINVKDVKHSKFMEKAYGVLRNDFVKRLVYFFDLFIFLFYRLYLEKFRNHILIMDRYFYDSLADVADGHRWQYIRLFLLITPIPDLPIFVDVSAEEAFARKGEYTLDYMKKRRTYYLKIFSLVRQSTILANNNLDKTLHDLKKIVMV